MQSPGANTITRVSSPMLSSMEKISISPQAECVRLLVVEQGINLRV